ncbi:ecotropic viral integration site [Pelomyxa schiedti]|nr:ecotropic viral integration site [Pelomyxa schiedti]
MATGKDRTIFERKFRRRSSPPGSYTDVVEGGKDPHDISSLTVNVSASSASLTSTSTSTSTSSSTSLPASSDGGTPTLPQEPQPTQHKRRLSLLAAWRKTSLPKSTVSTSGTEAVQVSTPADGKLAQKSATSASLTVTTELSTSSFTSPPTSKRHSVQLLSHAYDADQTTLVPLSSRSRHHTRQSSSSAHAHPTAETSAVPVEILPPETTTASSTTTTSSISTSSASTDPSTMLTTLAAKIAQRSDVDKKYSEMGADFFELDPSFFTSKEFTVEGEARPPLHRAVFLGAEEVQAELGKSTNIHARCTADNSTALHVAVLKGDSEVIKILLKAGAAQDAQDKSNNTPLHLATHNCNDEVIQILLEECPKSVLNTRNVDGNTPLHIAVIMRNTQITTTLLALKPDSNVYNVAGYVPLHIAIVNGDFKTAEALLKAGADPNARGPYQETTLHQAVLGHSEKPEIVALLLQNQADPRLSDGAGNIPLYYALCKKREATIAAFVQENPIDMCYVYDFKLQLLKETHPESLLPKNFTSKSSKDVSKWEKMMGEWDKVKKTKIRKAYLKGVPATIRPVVWVLSSRASSLRAKNASTYALLSNASPPTSILAQIDTDVKRVVQLELFQTVDHEALQFTLFKLLRIYAVHDPSLGYRQGMAEIAAFLLLHLDEENSFWTFVQLMSDENYSLRIVFLEGNSALLKFFATQKQLLSQDLPQVWAHFKARAVESRLQVYVIDWFLTLYLSVLPYEIVAGVFDLMFYEGYEVLYAVTVAIFYTFRKEILAVNDDGLLVNKVRDIHLLFKSSKITPEEFLESTCKFLHNRKELPTFSSTPARVPTAAGIMSPSSTHRATRSLSPPRKDSNSS